MPPLWLIIGTAVIIGVVLTIDRLVFKPRSRIVFVGGNEYSFRRQKDSRLTYLAMGGMFLVLISIGLLLEGNLVALPLATLPFAVIFGIALRVMPHEHTATPTDEDLSRAKDLQRRIYVMFGVALTAFALGKLGDAVGHLLGSLLIAAEWVLGAVVLWLAWRLVQAARELRRTYEAS
jgi:hypothetical protein